MWLQHLEATPALGMGASPGMRAPSPWRGACLLQEMPRARVGIFSCREKAILTLNNHSSPSTHRLWLVRCLDVSLYENHPAYLSLFSLQTPVTGCADPVAPASPSCPRQHGSRHKPTQQSNLVPEGALRRLTLRSISGRNREAQLLINLTFITRRFFLQCASCTLQFYQVKCFFLRFLLQASSHLPLLLSTCDFALDRAPLGEGQAGVKGRGRVLLSSSFT